MRSTEAPGGGTLDSKSDSESSTLSASANYITISLPRPHTLETAEWLKKVNEELNKPEVKKKIEEETREAMLEWALYGRVTVPYRRRP